MLYTPHFLVGAAILKHIPNPYIGLPLSAFSHIILDLIPHTDFDIKPGMTIKSILFHKHPTRIVLLTAMTIDFILLLISFFWIAVNFNKNLWMLLGGITAISPDVIEQGFLLLGKPLTAIQDKFQNRVGIRYGLISYPIVSLIAIYFLQR